MGRIVCVDVFPTLLLILPKADEDLTLTEL